MALFFALLAIFVSSEAYSVTYSYSGNPTCDGTATSIVINDDEPCVNTTCTTDGPTDSYQVRCGPLKAIVTFTPSADAGITGSVTFEQINSTAVSVTLSVTGITTNPDGQHGMHVHQWGDLRGFIAGAGVNVTKAASVGSHWNPSGNNHSCPEEVRHDGDLGNWDAVGGVIDQTKEISSGYITLVGTNSIIGHAVVLHATTDDCANTLSAGARLATGVVGIANVAGNLAYADIFSSTTSAVCVFVGTSLNNFAIGTAGLVQMTEEGGSIRILAHTIGVPGGIDDQVGFHSHVYGDISDIAGGSVGGHWNLDGAAHGLPTVNAARHLGDFGTIRINGSNHGFYDFLPDDYTPASSMKIANFLGHAIVIHADIDHGNEPTCPGSEANGASGARALFCVLGVPNPANPNTPGFYLENIDTTGLTLDNTWANVPCPTPEPEPTPEPVAPTTEELTNSMNNAELRERVSAFIAELSPPGAVETYGEPQTTEPFVHWTITIIYDTLLSDVDKVASENALRQQLADEFGTDLDKITLVFELVDDNVFVGKRAIQAVAYDAVITVSGAASVVASALLSLVFLALFI